MRARYSNQSGREPPRSAYQCERIDVSTRPQPGPRAARPPSRTGPETEHPPRDGMTAALERCRPVSNRSLLIQNRASSPPGGFLTANVSQLKSYSCITHRGDAVHALAQGPLGAGVSVSDHHEPISTVEPFE